MAELSKIRKNGVDYDIKDAVARKAIEDLEIPESGTVTPEQIASAIDAKMPDIISGVVTKIPVVGVVDDNNNITIYGDLESGEYSLRYEHDDGTTTVIGSIIVEGSGDDGSGDDEGSGGDDEPVAKELTSVSASYNGGSVPVGTAVNTLIGVKVTAHYSDGTSEIVTGYTLSGEINEGANTITVTYNGFTATFEVTGIASVFETSLAPAFTEWTDPGYAFANYTRGTNSFEVYWDGSLPGTLGAMFCEFNVEAGRTVVVDCDLVSSTGVVEGIGFNIGSDSDNGQIYAKYANSRVEITPTTSNMYFQFKVSSSSYKGEYPVTVNVNNFRVYYLDTEGV